MHRSSPGNGVLQSNATLVASSDTLADGTPIICSVDDNRLSLGSSSTLSGRRVASALSQDRFVRLVSSTILAQGEASSTKYYVLVGSSITDGLIMRIAAEVCESDPADAYCHMFASPENHQLVCETLAHDELRSCLENASTLGNIDSSSSAEDSCASLLRGIAYVTLTFRNGNARAVIVGGTRISVAMIALLEVRAGSNTSVFLSIGRDLSLQNALSLVHEFEALAELLRGDHDAEDAGAPKPNQQINVVADISPPDAEVSWELARLKEENRTLAEAVDAARQEATERLGHANELRQRLEALQSAHSIATRRAASVGESEHARLQEERERHEREREGLTLRLDALQRQVDQLVSSNRGMEGRILEHQQERHVFEKDRHTLQRQLEAAEMRTTNITSAFNEAKEEFVRQQRAIQRELMQTAMDFQLREREWQRELADACNGTDDLNRRVAELEARIHEQSRAAARDAEEFAAHHHNSEMESLLYQVKALSPLGKLLSMPCPFQQGGGGVHHHHHHSAALRLDPYPTPTSNLSFQRDASSPFRSARRSASNPHRTLVSPHPGDWNLDI